MSDNRHITGIFEPDDRRPTVSPGPTMSASPGCRRHRWTSPNTSRPWSRGAPVLQRCGRRSPFCPPGHVRWSEDRLCEPHSQRLDLRRRNPLHGPSITTTVQGEMWGDARGELVQLLAADHLVPDIVEFGQHGLELVVLLLEVCRTARRDSSGSRPQLSWALLP